jgi:hypothetical protein
MPPYVDVSPTIGCIGLLSVMIPYITTHYILFAFAGTIICLVQKLSQFREQRHDSTIFTRVAGLAVMQRVP